ncbi:amiloride-sensitive sodium channel subunit alpha-like [Acropora millepora]|uniref:amiloride-sensitive sodium channel subunit alpha-like n=1 Tax=Acropora millepora TaxID=45264 RepID=UPI001CF553C8|nr:amiloride-sensitive sodium channel subunit alpha-like [Acropora millepora]XP_029186300.2 amiloride-sensitive sodium channel subunit alpha-like [Acropora millepora]
MAGDGSNDSVRPSTMTHSTKELIKDFANYTTTHGVGRLSEAKTVFSRLVWSIFILCALGMFIFQTLRLFESFMSRPVSTLIQVKHATKARFPAVTVCNQNPVRIDKIPDDYFGSIHQEIQRRFLNDSRFLGNPSIDANFSNYSSVDPELEVEIEHLFEDMLIGKLATENTSTLFNMGHQFQDFVFECNFKGIDCRNYSKFWTRFWDYRYGNCFDFNGGIGDNHTEQEILKTHNTGQSGGLKLNLFIHTDQYTPQLSHASGARIVIHDQDELPFPDEEGINAHPGISTSVGVRKEVIIRVDPFNNGSCKKQILDGKSLPYSRELCVRSCLADAQIAKCGCAESQFAVNVEGICEKSYDPSVGKCLDNLVWELTDGNLNCQEKCPAPCREVVFKTSVSMAEWPSERYKDILFKRLTKRLNQAYDDQLSEGKEFFSKNFLQVRVFYERLNYQEVEERRSYKEVNLLADIGGQLGLWIGVSALTCCEFLELLWLLGKNAMNRIATKKGNRVESLSRDLNTN